MRVVITGSPKSNVSSHVMNGWMYEYFKNHEIVQLSRSSGYDFNNSYDRALEVATTADVFVNSAVVEDYQIKFLNDLYGKVPKIISLGSIAADFSNALEGFYPNMKQKLKLKNRLLPLQHMNNSTDLLHITITEVENIKESINGLNFQQLSKILDFWFENPFFINIDLKYFIDKGYQETFKVEKVQRVLKYYGHN